MRGVGDHVIDLLPMVVTQYNIYYKTVLVIIYNKGACGFIAVCICIIYRSYTCCNDRLSVCWSVLTSLEVRKNYA